MIYQTSKTQDLRFKIKDSRQAGVTLLLAILILSSVLAISFSLATILFIEVRTSGDLLKTEPAYYAATGVGEQSLFNLERHTCSSDGHDCSYTSNFANSAVLNGTPTVQSSSTPTITDKVKAGSTFATTLSKYDFCDVTAGGSGCDYGRVTVSYITTNPNSNPLYVYLCEFKTSFGAAAGLQDSNNYATVPCTDTSLVNSQPQSYWNMTPFPLVGTKNSTGPNAGSFTLIPDGSVTWTLTPTMQQQLILTNPSTNDAADIYVKIQTYADAVGSSPKGLPYVGKTAVNINTTNAAVGRKIQVIVPSSNSSSGGAGGPVVGYAHHRQITINGGQVPSSQANFPVLVSGTFPYLADAAHGGGILSGGTDIVFTSDSAGSSILPYEQEKYVSTTGEIEYWVNLPTVSNGTSFYMFYDKAGASDQSNKTAVWNSNFKGVYHFANTAGLSLKDSTANLADASGSNSTATNGLIDGALNLNGAAAHVTLPSNTNGFGVTTSGTFSGWFNVPNLASGAYVVSDWNSNVGMTLRADSAASATFYIYPNNFRITTAYAFSTGVWYYLAGVLDGSNMYLYINGNPSGSLSAVGPIGNSVSKIVVGDRGDLANGSATGKFDEVHISNSARSSDWIKTEYNNQSSPAAFYTIGAEN